MIDIKKPDMLGHTFALSLIGKSIWKGDYREYWRNGRQQKLLDLDGIMDRCVDGPAAGAGWKLEALLSGRKVGHETCVNQRPNCWINAL